MQYSLVEKFTMKEKRIVIHNLSCSLFLRPVDGRPGKNTRRTDGWMKAKDAKEKKGFPADYKIFLCK